MLFYVMKVELFGKFLIICGITGIKLIIKEVLISFFALCCSVFSFAGILDYLLISLIMSRILVLYHDFVSYRVYLIFVGYFVFFE